MTAMTTTNTGTRFRRVFALFLLPLFVLLNTSFNHPPIQSGSLINSKSEFRVPKLLPDSTLHTDSLPRNYFISPLDVPLTIVGNFGEPRRLHFHTGMDFRTNQEEGHAVFAAAEGYVSRINVSGAGYGNALYITHPNGYVTVYGHLQRFNSKITERLRKEQYSKENFAVDFNLLPTELTVKQGDTIALSGNTGGSGGPHLHFEIRDSMERVYNPMLFDYKLKDNIKPVLSFLKFYPHDSLKYKCDGYRTRLIGKQGIYETTTGIVKLNSPQVSISVNTHDAINLSDAHIGIYNITAFDGNKMFFESQFDRISFSDKRSVLSHIDYPIFMNEGRKSFHKTFIEPGNHCPIYSNVNNAGVLDISDGKPHDIHIEVSDFNGNVSLVKFKLQYDKTATLFKSKELKYVTRFDFDHANEFATTDFKIQLPEGSLFENIFLQYTSALSTEPGVFSKIHQVGNSSIQIADWFTVSVKAENLNAALASKAVVVYKDGNGSAVSRAGSFESGFVVAKAREMGTYYIRVDTTAPQIRALNVVAGRNMRTYKKLLFKITDNLSGIADFDTYLDNKWVVTEYDAKSATLTHWLDTTLVTGEHTFKVVVTDERKNQSEFSVKFLL